MPFRNPFLQDVQVEFPAPIRAAIKKRLMEMIEGLPTLKILRERDLRNMLIVHGVPGVPAQHTIKITEQLITDLLTEAGFEPVEASLSLTAMER